MLALLVYEQQEIATNDYNETLITQPLEFKQRTLSGYGSHISSDFQLLNSFNTLDKPMQDIPLARYPKQGHSNIKFSDVAEENFIDSNVFDIDKGTQLNVLPHNRPVFLNRENVFENAWSNDRHSDNFFQNYPLNNSVKYHTKDYRCLLGFMVHAHPFNTLNDVDYNRFLNYCKEKGISSPSSLGWTPISKDIDKQNDIIRTTDYARYVYASQIFLDPTDPNKKQFKLESNNNVRFWYKDSSGYASAIRPLEISEFLSKFSTSFVKDEDVKPGVPLDTVQRIPNSLYYKFWNVLRNKIIVVEHRRVNLTGNEKDPNCPILTYYLNQGWSIEEDNPESYQEPDYQSPIKTLFNKVKEIMHVKIGTEPRDHGIFRETTYRSSLRYVDTDKRSEQELEKENLRSILLVKTTMIDVEQVGLQDKDCVYIPPVDLIIGKMKSGVGEDKIYPIDHYQHPHFKYHLHRGENRENIDITYVSDDPRDSTPLYSNTHGLVTKVDPVKHSKLKPGLYIQKDHDIHYVPLEEMHKYGFFYSHKDAVTYNVLSTEMLKNVKEGRENLLRDKKFEQDLQALEIKNEALIHTKELQELIQQTKRLEINGKNNELDLKKMDQRLRVEELNLKAQEVRIKQELLEKQKELEEVKFAHSVIDNATKVVTSAITTATKIGALL